MTFKVTILNPVTGLPLDLNTVGGIITFDGEEVINTADFTTTTLINYTLANGVKIVALFYNGATGVLTGNLEFPYCYNASYNNLVVSTIQLGLTIQPADALFPSYSNTFTLVGYDVGLGGVTPDFTVYIVPIAETGFYPKFAAWRKPFTGTIFVYNTSTSPGSIQYAYNKVGGTNIQTATTNNFTFCEFEDAEITQTNGTETITVTLDKITWFPNFSLGLTCPNCVDGDCTSTTQANTATTNIDFPIDVLSFSNAGFYSGRYYRLVYLLYDNNGNLLQYKYDHFIMDNDSDSYDSSLHTWDFTPPEQGSYLIKVALGVFGLRVQDTITSGDVTANNYYIIVDASDGDFLNVGAPDSNKGTIFWATDSVAPTSYGTAGLRVLDLMQECYVKKVIQACNWVEVKKDPLVCGTQLVTNNNLANIIYFVEKLNTDNVFESFIATTIITPNTTATIALPDGIFKLTITRDYNGEEQILTYIIPVYCTVIACEKDKILALLCKATPCGCPEPCGDVCEKNYDFNAFVTLLHSYKLLIDKDYQLGNGYNIIDIPNLDSLATANEFLAKLTEYCTECNKECN